jgi:hypothetical protein
MDTNNNLYFTNNKDTNDNICIKNFNKKNMKIMYSIPISKFIEYVKSETGYIEFCNNIKITIKNKWKDDSNIGKSILYNLGYNIDSYEKIILKCRRSLKSFPFNKKINNVLMIIVNYNGTNNIFIYNIYKKQYMYNSTYLQQDEMTSWYYK